MEQFYLVYIQERPGELVYLMVSFVPKKRCKQSQVSSDAFIFVDRLLAFPLQRQKVVKEDLLCNKPLLSVYAVYVLTGSISIINLDRNQY